MLRCSHCSKLKVCFILTNISWAFARYGIFYAMREESKGRHTEIARRHPHPPKFLLELNGEAEHRILTPHTVQWVLGLETWVLWKEKGTTGSDATGCECLQKGEFSPYKLWATLPDISNGERALGKRVHWSMPACNFFRSSPEKPNPYTISVSFRKHYLFILVAFRLRFLWFSLYLTINI